MKTVKIVFFAASVLLVSSSNPSNQTPGVETANSELGTPPILPVGEESFLASTANNPGPSFPWSSSDERLNPVVTSAKGDLEGDSPHSRHRRIIVVYPDFDLEDDHHDRDHGYGHKKGYASYGTSNGNGGYGGGGGYGSSTHYQPGHHPPTKYGYGGKKYYRRLRGPLSPILNWYYFGYL